jgi:hypothetical protein
LPFLYLIPSPKGPLVLIDRSVHGAGHIVVIGDETAVVPIDAFADFEKSLKSGVLELKREWKVAAEAFR